MESTSNRHIYYSVKSYLTHEKSLKASMYLTTVIRWIYVMLTTLVLTHSLCDFRVAPIVKVTKLTENLYHFKYCERI